MWLSFGSNNVTDGSLLDWATAQKTPQISWKNKKNTLYTVVIYDLDFPNFKNQPYMHHLTINVPGDNIADGDELLSYVPPNPQDKAHRYVISVYEQRGLMGIDGQLTRKNLTLPNLKNLGRLYASLHFRVSPKGVSSPRTMEKTMQRAFPRTQSPLKSILRTPPRKTTSPRRITFSPTRTTRSPTRTTRSPTRTTRSPTRTTRSPRRSRSRSTSRERFGPNGQPANYFLPGTRISKEDQKWCRCLAHTAGQKGYNKFALCGKLPHTHDFPCSQYFDYANMPPAEVRALKSFD